VNRERRLEQLARAAARHPDVYARACAAAVLLQRERQQVSAETIRTVAESVDVQTAEHVAELAAAEPGRSQVGGRAYKGIAELEPAAFGLG
jgi:hypothetical protein